MGEIGGGRRRMCEQCDGGDSDGVTGEVVGAAPFGLRGPGLAYMSAVTATSEVLPRRSPYWVDRGHASLNHSFILLLHL